MYSEIALSIISFTAMLLGFITGYILSKFTIVKKSPTNPQTKQPYKHLVEIVTETQDVYTYVTITIDNVVGNRSQILVTKGVSEIISQHLRLTYAETISRDSLEMLESICALRQNVTIFINTHRYKIVFK